MASVSERTVLRRRPEQARSSATFDALLDAAASLLESQGTAAFTTNRLAAESGISIRAIYRYFPNKQAIIAELARGFSLRWLEAVSAAGDLGDLDADWESVWRGYVATWVRGVLATTGGRAVIAAMRDDPELRVIDDDINERYIAGIADALRRRKPELTATHAVAVAGVLMRSTVGVLDAAVTADEPSRTRLVDELHTMHAHYLRHVLGESAASVAVVGD